MPESSCSSAVKRACDACHRRKVKCLGDGTQQSCKNCNQAGLKCTYNAVPQKKGPKGSRAKVISELRETQRHVVATTIKDRFDFSSPPTSPVFSRAPNFLPVELIKSCVDYFFANIFPTQPILNRARVDLMVSEMYHSVEAYCLIVTLCAYMMIQPNMKLPPAVVLTLEDFQAEDYASLGATLLAEAIEARKASNYTECPSSVSVTTSFFLFGCYFCLEKHNTAYFYLREATTLALLIGMDHENCYVGDDVLDSGLKRRLFWLLFVTERAYALQMQRPLSLHATIALPDVDQDPNEAVQLTGFNHLIVLFKPFDDTFVGMWNQSIDGANIDWITALQKQLTAALPQYLRSTETQTVDLRTSQQWLRIMIWQLSISHRLLSSTAAHSALTFRYPLELSRQLAAEASRFSQEAMEVHGIGLIKKVFDVACTLIDVMTCLPLESNGFELGPRDYLNHFLHLVSRLRGGRTRYLPLLLSKASDALPSLAGLSIPQGLPSSLGEHFEELADDDISLDDSTSNGSTSSGPPSLKPEYSGEVDFFDLVNNPSYGSADVGTPYAVVAPASVSYSPQAHRGSFSS